MAVQQLTRIQMKRALRCVLVLCIEVKHTRSAEDEDYCTVPRQELSFLSHSSVRGEEPERHGPNFGPYSLGGSHDNVHNAVTDP